MPACARKEIVAEGEVVLYHCVSRCVRRAFLCGQDKVSGRNFEHRKGWVEDRLQELAGVFAADVCGFAVMGNHLHVLVRTRPDLAEEWSDEEVVRRWWRLCPGQRDVAGELCEGEEFELNELLVDQERVALWRQRLSSLSWFMRFLCERIARLANREDGVHGRFWEGRFKSQQLADERAALACSIYVDLNPIRAGIAETPESSEHTSAYQRIRGHKEGPSRRRLARKRSLTPADAWLCPIGSERDSADPQTQVDALNHGPGFLTMDLDDYLALLDWAGREVRADKRGGIPPTIAPILERLHLQADGWLACVKNFGRWFRQGIVGHVKPRAAPA